MALSDIFGDFKAELTGGQTSIQKKIPGVKGGFAPAVGVVNVWRGLGTTSKVLVGAGAGATVYAGYDWLFGGKKAVPQKQDLQQKEELKQESKQIITPTYAGRDYVYNPTDSRRYYQTDIISGGTGSIYSEKKFDVAGGQTPVLSQPIYAVQAPDASQAQSAEQKQAAGTDFVTIAAILSVAFVAATYFKGKRK